MLPISVGGLCKVCDCGKKIKGLGYCNLHYQRKLRGTDLHRPRVPLGQKGRECSADGCSKPHVAKGYCQAHYATLVLKTRGYNWYEGNKSRSAENGRRWRSEHPARAEAIALKRRLAMVAATPAWLTSEHWDQMDAIYFESKRLSEETGVEHQVDHIWPISGKSSCGLHVPWNLQVLTGVENRKKGNREPLSEAA